VICWLAIISNNRAFAISTWRYGDWFVHRLSSKGGACVETWLLERGEDANVATHPDHIEVNIKDERDES